MTRSAEASKTAEEWAEFLYPEGRASHGWRAVREAFEAGAEWATTRSREFEPSEVQVEEAASAIQEAARDLYGFDIIRDRAKEMTREYARRAFAVFEKSVDRCAHDWEPTIFLDASNVEGEACVKCETVRIEAQSEPSDAQVEAAAAALYFEDCGAIPEPAVLVSDDYDAQFREYARVALRAAGGVR